MKILYPPQSKEDIRIFDNQISNYLIKSSDDQLTSIIWEYGHRTYDDNHDIGTDFFGYMFYYKPENLYKPVIPFANVLLDCIQYEIAPKIGKFNGFYKAVFNGQTPNQDPGIHNDSEQVNNFWTAVYYYNNATGGTEFFNNNTAECITTVKFKQGRFVVFPSWYNHRAQQTTSPFRISLGIMFEVLA